MVRQALAMGSARAMGMRRVRNERSNSMKALTSRTTFIPTMLVEHRKSQAEQGGNARKLKTRWHRMPRRRRIRRIRRQNAKKLRAAKRRHRRSRNARKISELRTASWGQKARTRMRRRRRSNQGRSQRKAGRTIIAYAQGPATGKKLRENLVIILATIMIMIL